MAEITIQDCEDLYNQFSKYAENAEQHEFAKLAIVQAMLNGSKRRNWDMPQKHRRSMFRVVLKTIGGDYAQYEEEEDAQQAMAE